MALPAWIPGAYAWAVTVVPCAFAHGTSLAARVAAAFSPIFLALGDVALRRGRWRVRIGCLWVFVLGCAVVWTTASRCLAASRVDPLQGLAGVVAWALFAFAFATAPVRPLGVDGFAVERVALEPRRALKRGDVAVVVAAGLVALGLQLLGWPLTVPEQALFVRFFTLSAGLALLGLAAGFSVSKYRARVPSSVAARPGRATRALMVAGLLLFAASSLASALLAQSGCW